MPSESQFNSLHRQIPSNLRQCTPASIQHPDACTRLHRHHFKNAHTILSLFTLPFNYASTRGIKAQSFDLAWTLLSSAFAIDARCTSSGPSARRSVRACNPVEYIRHQIQLPCRIEKLEVCGKLSMNLWYDPIWTREMMYSTPPIPGHIP